MADIKREGARILINNDRIVVPIPITTFSFKIQNNNYLFYDGKKFALRIPVMSFPEGDIWKAVNIKGKQGERGPKGDRGADGISPKIKDVSEGVEIIDADGKRAIVKHGRDGEKGIQGEQGIQGEKGDSGQKGQMGEKGDRGERGEKGDRGEKGEKGDRGSDGKDGRDGARGIQGERGPIGLRGAKGEKGLQWSGSYEDDSYLENEVVDYKGSLYIAIRNVPEDEPPVIKNEDNKNILNQKYWDLFIAKPKKGEKGEKGEQGTPGPRGLPGSAIIRKFTIIPPTTDHIFTHNFGEFPDVYVVNSAGDEVEVCVIHLNLTQIRIIHNNQFNGTVFVQK